MGDDGGCVMIDLNTETIAQVRPEIGGLLAAHYDELATDKRVIRLDPDWGKYEGMERNRSLLIFTARQDGRLVGYSVFFLVWGMHCKSNLFGQNDLIFLDRSARMGGTGVRLIRYSAEQIKEAGADKILWHAKPGTALHKILIKLGYIEQDIILGKAI